jgi:predicted outer membrane repeat protein
MRIKNFVRIHSARDSVFQSNRAASYGGSLSIDGPLHPSSQASFINCTFEQNQSLDAGGAVYVDARWSAVNSHFKNNTASRGGGAVFATVSYSRQNLLYSKLFFFDIFSTLNNLWIVGYQREGSIVDSKFRYNDAGIGAGGGICVMLDAQILKTDAPTATLVSTGIFVELLPNMKPQLIV